MDGPRLPPSLQDGWTLGDLPATLWLANFPGRFATETMRCGHPNYDKRRRTTMNMNGKSHPSRWKPKTARGRRLADLLEKGRDERHPLLSEAQIEQELNERRGRSIKSFCSK